MKKDMIRIPQSKNENAKSNKAKSPVNSAVASAEETDDKGDAEASGMVGLANFIVGQQVEVLQNGDWVAGSITGIPRNEPPQYTVRLDSKDVVDNIGLDAIRPRKEDLVSDEDSDDDTSDSEEETDGSDSDEVVTGSSAADVVSKPEDQVEREEILKAVAKAKNAGVIKDGNGVGDNRGGDEHHENVGDDGSAEGNEDNNAKNDSKGKNEVQEEIAHGHETSANKSNNVRETPTEVGDNEDVAPGINNTKSTAIGGDQKTAQKPNGDAAAAKETTDSILSKGSQVEVCLSKDTSATASWELGEVVARHSKPPLASSSRKRRAKTPAITFDVKILSSGKVIRKIASDRVRPVLTKSEEKEVNTSSTPTVDGLKKAQLPFGAVVEVQRIIQQEKTESNEGSDAKTLARKGDPADEKSQSKIAKTGKTAETDDKAGAKENPKAHDERNKSEGSVTDRGRVVRASSDGKWLDIVMYDCSLRCRVPREQVIQNRNCGFAQSIENFKIYLSTLPKLLSNLLKLGLFV